MTHHSFQPRIVTICPKAFSPQETKTWREMRGLFLQKGSTKCAYSEWELQVLSTPHLHSCVICAQVMEVLLIDCKQTPSHCRRPGSKGQTGNISVILTYSNLQEKHKVGWLTIHSVFPRHVKCPAFGFVLGLLQLCTCICIAIPSSL